MSFTWQLGQTSAPPVPLGPTPDSLGTTDDNGVAAVLPSASAKRDSRFTGAPAGCCGFFQPSSELVNSFRTDANGLPLLDGSYNDPANLVKVTKDLKLVMLSHWMMETWIPD